jgi:superfamily II DNA/RNA helicase
MMRITLSETDKISFVQSMFKLLTKTMTMVFVNRKKNALALQEKLKQLKIEAKILIGGMELKERDEVID